MALPNYVKFQRGSMAAYNRLAVKDENTLYFIFDAVDQTKGSLYLGDKLISSNVGGAGASSLAELSDVLVSSAQTGDFLVKNSQGKWTAIGATAVAATIIEAGGLTATIDIDEDEFQFNAVDGKLELKGYTAATAGFIPVKGENGLLWQAAPIDLSSRVGSLEQSVSAVHAELVAVDGKIATAVAAANHLTYTVISNLDEAIAENTVYLKPSTTTSANDLYEEFMIVNGSLEKLGNFGIDLSGYATTSAVSALETQVNAATTAIFELNSRVGTLESNYVTSATFASVVGNLNTLHTYHSNGTATSVVDAIQDIYERLIWIDMVEE